MTLSDFGLLTDENVHPEVVAWLRAQGFDVLDVCDEGLQGSTDRVLLQRAVAESRVVVTHDSDFGTLAIAAGQPCIGIVFVRPGDINPQNVIGTLRTVLAQAIEVRPPFMIVARRRGPQVTIRVRQLSVPEAGADDGATA